MEFVIVSVVIKKRWIVTARQAKPVFIGKVHSGLMDTGLFYLIVGLPPGEKEQGYLW